MKQKFKHFLLTKFNLGLYSGERQDKNNKKIDGDSWMMHRLQLFERYCLPSITHQTNSNFTWILLLDPKTPASYLARIACYRRICKNMVVGIGGWFDQYIKMLLPKDVDYLITTRIDNDDALNIHAIDLIQRSFRPYKSQLIGFPLGYHWEKDRLYLNSSGCYSFLSLVEKVHRPNGKIKIRTVRCKDHLQFYKSSNILYLAVNTPMWLQVIHDHNLINKAKGIPVPLHRLQKMNFGFPVFP